MRLRPGVPTGAADSAAQIPAVFKAAALRQGRKRRQGERRGGRAKGREEASPAVSPLKQNINSWKQVGR